MIYLDYNATTPVDPRVLEEMLPYFSERFGNSSSLQHRFGWDAEKAVERAREQVAALIQAHPSEIIFTSGATESINFAIKGIVESYGSAFNSAGCRIVSTAIEHKAALEAIRIASGPSGLEHIFELPVDHEGRISVAGLKDLKSKPLLVSLMWANNEIGVLNPIDEIAQWTAENEIFFHSDGVQALGHHPLNVKNTPIDLMSFSAHKIYGPKGAGALFIRKKSPRIKLNPQIHGGGHERGLRAGTLNVPAIVGFGKACEILSIEGTTETLRMSQLRDRLHRGLAANVPELKLNGPALSERLFNNLSLVFPVMTRTLLPLLVNQIAVSSGSACLSQDGPSSASHVLKAIGLSSDEANSTLRFSVGRATTEANIDEAILKVTEAVKHATTA